MISRVIKGDLAIFGLVAAFLILALTGRAMWLDCFVGAAFALNGVFFLLIGFGALPRFRRRSGTGFYLWIGIFSIVQGVALGVFHVKL